MSRPWNWCHKCRQPVDVADVHDGSVVQCWGCRREFAVVAYDGDTWGLYSERQQRRQNQRPGALR